MADLHHTSLTELAAGLKAHPAATIRVESHTDNVRTQESNLNLSQARADSIKRCATAVGEGAMVVRFVHGLRAAVSS